jgi:hypothetical protein
MPTTTCPSQPSKEDLAFAAALGQTMAEDVVSGIMCLIAPKADPIDTASHLLVQNLQKFGDQTATLTTHAKSAMLSKMGELKSRPLTSAAEKYAESTRMLNGRSIRWWAEVFANGIDILNKSGSPLARPHWDQVHIVIRNVSKDIEAKFPEGAERDAHLEEFLDWFHELLPEPPEGQKGLMAFAQSITNLVDWEDAE